MPVDASAIPTACTTAVHAAIKADQERWLADTEPLPGHARRCVMGEGDDWLELANCRICRSTLARPIDIRLLVRT